MSGGPEAALSVRASARFARGGFALDVAFDAPPGITALVGPSGAGKTLTLRAVAGLLRPNDGRVVCAGRVLLDTRAGVDVPARARRVGYAFQQYALFPHLSAAANVAFGLHGRPRAERAARARELLALVGLADRAGHRPHALSGGEQQRVALARALAPSPDVLLLDEPFSALDPSRRLTLRAAVRAIHERTRVPMLLVTHDPADADALADHAVFLDAGRVTRSGSARALLGGPAAR